MNRFPATDWVVVLSLRHDDAELARQALGSLCRIYWYPLYAFARRRGYSKEDAADTTQDFFIHLLERNTMLKADQGKGLFRSFLLASFRHYLSNRETRVAAKRRSPASPVISLDSEAAEAQFSRDLSARSPEEEYERAWAVAVAERAWKKLSYRHSTEERARRFRCLCPFIVAETPRMAYGAISSELGMTIGALKVATSRLRREFLELVREELVPLAASEVDLDAEVVFVLSRLAGSRFSELPAEKTPLSAQGL